MISRILIPSIVMLFLLISCATNEQGATVSNNSLNKTVNQTKPLVIQMPTIARTETFYADGSSSGSVEYTFDEKGNVLQEDQLNGKKILIQRKKYAPIDGGKKVEITIQNGTGEIQGYAQKEYDSKKNLIRETLLTAKKEIQSLSEYTWDTNNILTEWISRGQNNIIIAKTVYTITNGLTTLIDVQDASGKLIKRFEQTFNQDGTISAKIEKDPQNKVLSHIAYQYADGKLVHEDYKNANGVTVRSIVYLYNEKNLPIKVQFLDKTGKVLETRTQEFQVFSRTETTNTQP